MQRDCPKSRVADATLSDSHAQKISDVEFIDVLISARTTVRGPDDGRQRPNPNSELRRSLANTLPGGCHGTRK